MANRSNTHVIGVLERKEQMNRSNSYRDNDWEFSKTDQRHQTIDERSVMNPQQNKYKENYIWAHPVKLLKTKNKQKICTTTRDKN